ncbi:hypothetical protein P9112_010477 [Eukaryota sp. TZLM1-RC]
MNASLSRRRVLGNTNRRSLASKQTSTCHSICLSKQPSTSSLNDPSTLPFSTFDVTRTRKTKVPSPTHSHPSTFSKPPIHINSTSIPTKPVKLVPATPIDPPSQCPSRIRRENLSVPKRTWKGRYASTESIIKPPSDSSAFAPESIRFDRSINPDQAPQSTNHFLARIERRRQCERQIDERKHKDLAIAQARETKKLESLACQQGQYLKSVAESDPHSERIRKTCLPGKNLD